ncbi:MAG: hypothetical protein NUV67_01015 [archaeon]|nr:hypothetical protein [archaeon]
MPAKKRERFERAQKIHLKLKSQSHARNFDRSQGTAEWLIEKFTQIASENRRATFREYVEIRAKLIDLKRYITILSVRVFRHGRKADIERFHRMKTLATPILVRGELSGDPKIEKLVKPLEKMK